MKRHFSLLFLLLPLIYLLTACSSAGPGPVSWIDKPLDNTNIPLEPLEIIAHASSPSGVSSIEFTVNDEILGNVMVGNGRFEMASQIWRPEEPGTYTIGIRSTDTQGNQGDQAISIVYIGGVTNNGLIQNGPGYGECSYLEEFFSLIDPPIIPQGECTNLFWEIISPEEIEVIVDGRVVDPIGEMPVCTDETRIIELLVESPIGVCTQWQAVYVSEHHEEPHFQVFEAHPPVISKGECSILFWEVHPPGEILPEIDGLEVPFLGEMEVCPEVTTEYVLTSENKPESVAVIEVIDEGEVVTATPSSTVDGTTPNPTTSSGGGATSTPTKKPPSDPTDTPIPDTSPPSITNASVSPNDFIYNTNGSCSPTTFKFSVKVTDSSGISSVRLNWSGSGVRSGSENMNFSGGKYVKNLGLFVNTGSLSNFSITATDNAGNTSTKNLNWKLDVEECGGS